MISDKDEENNAYPTPLPYLKKINIQILRCVVTLKITSKEKRSEVNSVGGKQTQWLQIH